MFVLFSNFIHFSQYLPNVAVLYSQKKAYYCFYGNVLLQKNGLLTLQTLYGIL